MRSHGEGSLSATTQVKVLSPEITLIALGQGFHFLETNIRTHVTGEGVTDVPGSESVAGKRIVYIGTLRQAQYRLGRTEAFQLEAAKNLKK